MMGREEMRREEEGGVTQQMRHASAIGEACPSAIPRATITSPSSSVIESMHRTYTSPRSSESATPPHKNTQADMLIWGCQGERATLKNDGWKGGSTGVFKESRYVDFGGARATCRRPDPDGWHPVDFAEERPGRLQPAALATLSLP